MSPKDAIAAFLEQLDSNEVRVQIAAGEDIALLYEKSFMPKGDADSSPEENDDEDESDEDEGADPNMKKAYQAYHNAHEVLEKVSSLAVLSTRSINRRDKESAPSDIRFDRTDCGEASTRAADKQCLKDGRPHPQRG